MRAPADDSDPPLTFDEYRLVKLLGEGSMGKVYLAHDTVLDRPVAIKFIGSAQPDAEDRERFLTEARAIARLQHPNIVAIYRVGAVRGLPYLVSEFVRGQTLDSVPQPLTPEWVRRIALDLAHGLAAAHRRGVLHRDIKPGNVVLCDDGSAKLLDFGLAKLAGGEERAAPGLLPGALVSLPRDASPALTDPTIVLGTPLYIAPEIWMGAPASTRSDLYSLGVLLYEICSGHFPHDGASTLNIMLSARNEDAVPLAERVPGVDSALAALIHRCLERDPARRIPSAEALVEALDRLVHERERGGVPEGNPYRGLRAFEGEHRALFFGRESEGKAVVERLRGESLVVIAGDSGAGKSSLCRASVVPAVLEGALGARRWAVITMVPGRRPMTMLKAALAAELRTDEEELFAGDDFGELTAVRHRLRRVDGTDGIFLFVDQLEELLTVSDPEEAAAFGETLGRLAAGAPDVKVLATIRGDFLTRLAALPGFGADLGRALFLLRGLSRDGMRAAIVSPAAAKGVQFQSEALIETLVRTCERSAGALPLVQFALSELWEARDVEARRISASALDALGGVEGCLARHADGVFAALLPNERKAAQRVLTLLVGEPATRIRRGHDEVVVDAASRAAVEALIRGRLLVAHEIGGSTHYEIAHEALIEAWPQLRGWLERDGEARAVRARLAEAAREWERLGRARDALYRARQLRELARVDPADLDPRQRLFVARSRRAVRTRRGLVGALALATAALVGVAYGAAERRTARALDARLHEGARAMDEARAARRRERELSRTAFEAFDAQARERAERRWTEAQLAWTEADQQYARAAHLLEAAVAIDPSRATARRRLAEALYERALGAEARFRTESRDELLARMALHDDGGTQRARWEAPAALTLAIAPAGARVRVERYRAPADGRRALEAVTARADGPLALPPGSYLVTAEADGRAPVRLALLLARGETREVRFTLPPAARVPDGFVFVAPDRFLFGSAADEGLRRAFDTVPLHERTTGAYLIARRETTWGEWMAFVEALPASDRARRTPRVTAGGAQGALALERGADGRSVLHLQPGDGRAITLREWESLPVAGIDLDDARAYAAWLAASGRVPGARLCSELEWERAARGADGRELPHGERLLGGDANFVADPGRTGAVLRPMPVGSYPASRSPFGLDDTVGNVSEWTLSSLAAGEAVARGGPYAQPELIQRLPNRAVCPPTLRDLSVGVRLCAAAPPP